ncbi:MAG: hypothetical protein JXX29_17515 [Deltaproteobacteria bacterium]|nr:hypothetical protein [Deltaproteobacteria bacterium]MBN2673483.1 hypothetical protein [Deltaproteobacteria bacterium]
MVDRFKQVRRVFALMCLILIGCQDQPPAKPVNAGRALLCQGIIVATASRFITEKNEEPFEQFDFIAMFPKYPEDQQQEVDALLETHVPRADLAMDTCSVPEPQFHDNATDDNSVSISLVDAGDMFLQMGAGKVPIPTRTFPDLLKVIDGVIYAASPNHGIEFIPGQTYTLTNAGTDNIGSFEVVLEAPNDLGEVTLNGVSPADAVPSIIAGKGSTIRWEGEGYGDEVIADIHWSDMGLSWSMGCRMKDDGQFTIPGEITKQMTSELTDQTYEMRLSRVRQVSFAAPFIAFGDFSFVASTSFLVEFDKID